MVTSHCAEQIVPVCLQAGSAYRKGGTGGGGWGHPQGDMHMVAARLGSQRAMVWTRWVNSRPGCMNRLMKSAEYCMPVNEWVWLRSRVCLLRL